MKHTSFTRINSLRLYTFECANDDEFSLMYLIVCKLNANVLYVIR